AESRKPNAGSRKPEAESRQPVWTTIASPMTESAPTDDWLEGLLRPAPRRLVTAVALVLIVVPALITLTYVRLYGVNGPEWDHLTSAEIFERWDTGHLDAAFLWRPHNE